MDGIRIMDSDGYSRELLLEDSVLIEKAIFLSLVDDFGEKRHINLNEEGIAKLYNWLGRWIRENMKVEFVG